MPASNLFYILLSFQAVLAVGAQSNFPKDPECGKTKGCYSNCKNGNCGWEISWKEAGSNFNITLKSVSAGDDKWVALGFSTSAEMSPASVVACMNFNNSVVVKETFNPSYSNNILPNPAEGISNQNNEVTNGILQCSFSRATISSNPQIYNLTQPWYLITAKGDVNTDGTLKKHQGGDRYYTTSQINLTEVTTDEPFDQPTTTVTTPTAPSQTSKFPKDPRCGVSRGCYSNCDGDMCDLLFSWEDLGASYDMTLKAEYGGAGDHYIALGFSDSSGMDDASVVTCTLYQSKVDVFASFNTDHDNKPLSQPKEGLSNIDGSYHNGVLECNFTRETRSANNRQIYNISEPWYLISARGVPLKDGHIREHYTTSQTSSRVNLSDPTVDLALKDKERPLIKAHASLMAIGWMLSSSIGLAIARFFKKLWPENRLCNVKIWFAVHRGAMILTFLLGVTAFVLVFVEVKGYSTDLGETYKKAHPVLGIIVTCLLVINPIMSFLRCAPDDPKRPIFNYAHWAVGTSAHILSGVTITLGLYLSKAQVDKDKGLIIMIVYGVWHLIFFIIMSVLDWQSKTEPSKTVAASDQHIELTSAHNPQVGNKSYRLNTSGSQDALVNMALDNGEPPKSLAKKVMFTCHVLILAGLTSALLYLIVDGNN